MKKITRKQALTEGKKTYYTGRACVHGHKTWRYVSNYACADCYADAYPRMKERMFTRHGVKGGWEAIRAVGRVTQQRHRDSAGDKHVTYIREYMQAYRETEEGREKLYKAQQTYYYSPKGQARYARYVQSEQGKAAIARGRANTNARRRREAAERRALKL